MYTIIRRLAMFALVAAACVGGAAAQDADAEPITLRVMTYNILYGGDEIDFDKTIEVIQAADADIVGLQETEDAVPRIAEALGWDYIYPRLQLISKYPILDPLGAQDYVLIEVAPRRVVAFTNTHLTSDPYGPYAARDGFTPEALTELETTLRMPDIASRLDSIPPLIESGVPLFWTGDFNTPSHLDWTDEAVGVIPSVTYPFAWPVSTALADIGLRDSFREAHPNPAARPGITWTAGYAGMPDDEVMDRIGWILVAGDATTVSSTLLGEAGNPDVDVSVTPWPSDHRAVVSEFEVVPAPMPTLVAPTVYRVVAGEPLDVFYFRHGSAPGAMALSITDEAGTRVTEQAAAGSEGTLTFETADWTPGTYTAALDDAINDLALAQARFWVVAPDAEPTLALDKARYAVGEPIVATWRNLPAAGWDWIGIFPAGADEYSYLLYEYTDVQVNGTLTIDAGAVSVTVDGGAVNVESAWPLAPGDYEARLFPNDQYEVLAVVPFTVTE